MPRGKRTDGAAIVTNLKASVTALIRENRSLKRRVATLEARKAATRPPEGLAALQRRVERALTVPRRRRRRKVKTAG